MTPTTILTVFGWLSAIYSMFCLLTDVRTWVVTSRLYHGVPWYQAGKMLSLVMRSRIHYYLWGPIVPAAALFAFTAAGAAYPPIFTVSLFLFWLHIVLYQALPPSILLLGASGAGTLALRHALERGLYPYRVVVLLEPTAAISATDSLFTRNLFEWDNVRTSDGAWRASVFSLLETVPAIVVDTRLSTQGVVEEIQRMFNYQLDDKALFVTDDEGIAPALSAARVQVQAGSVLREKEIIAELKRSRFRHTASPDDNPILRNWGRQ